MVEPILTTVVVYNLRMCMKEDNPGPKLSMGIIFVLNAGFFVI